MPPKSTKKKPQASDAWKKLYVLEGDALLTYMDAEATKRDTNISSWVRMDDVVESKSLAHSLSRMTFEENPQGAMFTNPSTEVLKTIAEILDGDCLSFDAVMVLLPNAKMDARTVFAKSASKLGHVISNSPILASDTLSLKSHIKAWGKDVDISIGEEPMKWLLSNAPTILSDFNKNEEVFDLETLENELLKLSAVSDKQLDVAVMRRICSFQRANDIWALVEAACQGNHKTLLRLFERWLETESLAQVLFLVRSQLAFWLEVSTYLSAGVTSASDIAYAMKNARPLGQYLSDDWAETTPKPYADPNPWRIKKTIEGLRGTSIQDVQSRYIASCCAVADFRSGLAEDVLMNWLILALCGEVRYDEYLHWVS